MLYVVSDLQRSSCPDLGSCPIPEDLEVRVLNSGDYYSPNVGITELRIDLREGARPWLVVSSFCDEENIESKVELAIDGRVTLSVPLSLKAGAATNVSLALPALKPGWHEAKASLQTKDAIELDDTRFAPFFVDEPLRVLLVESRQTGRVFEQDSFFLAAALNPSGGSTNLVPSDFAVAQTAPEDLAPQLVRFWRATALRCGDFARTEGTLLRSRPSVIQVRPGRRRTPPVPGGWDQRQSLQQRVSRTDAGSTWDH